MAKLLRLAIQMCFKPCFPRHIRVWTSMQCHFFYLESIMRWDDMSGVTFAILCRKSSKHLMIFTSLCTVSVAEVCGKLIYTIQGLFLKRQRRGLPVVMQQRLVRRFFFQLWSEFPKQFLFDGTHRSGGRTSTWALWKKLVPLKRRININ